MDSYLEHCQSISISTKLFFDPQTSTWPDGQPNSSGVYSHYIEGFPFIAGLPLTMHTVLIMTHAMMYD